MISGKVFIMLLIVNIDVRSLGKFHYGKYQTEWSKQYSSCGGQSQSPVSIKDSNVFMRYFLGLETIGYHNFLPTPLRIHNNGHSVSLIIPKDDGTLPKIFGAKLSNVYELEGLHFHWGEENNRGSEHTINGIQYPMEMHIIHRNKKYTSVEEALKHFDGLTVLAVFFQLFYKDNKHLLPLVTHLHSISKTGETLALNETFILASLMPHDMDRFYTYQGSLTTPPCSEAVTWIIFPDTIPISTRQLNKFRKLSVDEAGTSLVDNYRNLQPIRQRKIYMRKLFLRDRRFLCSSKIAHGLTCD